jgi:hypothetical protein
MNSGVGSRRGGGSVGLSGGACAQYISLKAKRREKKTRKLQSGILPENKTPRSFRCTDYAR